MTWKDFKSEVQSAGVRDSDEIVYIMCTKGFFKPDVYVVEEHDDYKEYSVVELS